MNQAVLPHPGTRVPSEPGDGTPGHVDGTPRRVQNLTIVQALRGIAALWVVFFHASEGGHIPHLKATLPFAAQVAIFDAGHLGVAIFFALSGFVIAHSLAGSAMTGRSLGRFALRRSIRLDPAYWVSMLICVAAAWASAHLQQEAFAYPTAPQVAANLLYIQEMVGQPEINAVAWTLTYEIQFYLFFAAMLVLAGGPTGRANAFGRDRAVWGLMFVLALLSAAGAFDALLHGLFLNLWAAFFIGALACLAAANTRVIPFLAVLAAAMVARSAVTHDMFMAISAATALGLFVALRTGYAERGLRLPWLQFLGGISYSLYLTHNVVTGAVGQVLKRTIAPTGVLGELVALIVILSSCIAAATLLWLVVERPSHRLSRRIALRAKPA
jgi:peptidoglycan/LPS O-acetylase OafA/YrhL